MCKIKTDECNCKAEDENEFRLGVPEVFRRKPEKFDELLPVCIEYLSGAR